MTRIKNWAHTKSRQTNVFEHQWHSSLQHVSCGWENPDPFPIATSCLIFSTWLADYVLICQVNLRVFNADLGSNQNSEEEWYQNSQITLWRKALKNVCTMSFKVMQFGYVSKDIIRQSAKIRCKDRYLIIKTD